MEDPALHTFRACGLQANPGRSALRTVRCSGRSPSAAAARGGAGAGAGWRAGAQCARKVRAVCVQHSLWASPAAMRARQAIPGSAPRICARARLPSRASGSAAVRRPATIHLAAIGTLPSTVYTLTRPRAARATISLTSRSPSASVRPVAFPAYTSTRAASCVHFAHAAGRHNRDGAHVQPSGRYGPLAQRRGVAAAQGRGRWRRAGARARRPELRRVIGIHTGQATSAAGACVVYSWSRCLYFRGIRTNTPSHIVRSDHWVSIRSLLPRSNGMNMPLVRAAHSRAHRMRCAVPKSPPWACSIQVGQQQRNLPSKLFSARPRVGVQDYSWRGEQDVRWQRERLYLPLS